MRPPPVTRQPPGAVVVVVLVVVEVTVVTVVVVVVEHIRCAWLQTPWPSQPAVVQLLPSVSVHGVLLGLGGWSHIPVWGLHGGSSVHSFVSGVQVSTW